MGPKIIDVSHYNYFRCHIIIILVVTLKLASDFLLNFESLCVRLNTFYDAFGNMLEHIELDEKNQTVAVLII